MQELQLVFFGSHSVEQHIRGLISVRGGFDLAASTDSAADLSPLLERYQPPLLLLETVADSSTILSLVQKTRAQYPRMKFLVLVHTVDPAQVREFIRIGVSGCLLLESSLDGFETLIRLMQTGKLILSSEITHALLSS